MVLNFGGENYCNTKFNKELEMIYYLSQIYGKNFSSLLKEYFDILLKYSNVDLTHMVSFSKENNSIIITMDNGDKFIFSYKDNSIEELKFVKNMNQSLAITSISGQSDLKFSMSLVGLDKSSPTPEDLEAVIVKWCERKEKDNNLSKISKNIWKFWRKK